MFPKQGLLARFPNSKQVSKQGSKQGSQNFLGRGFQGRFLAWEPVLGNFARKPWSETWLILALGAFLGKWEPACGVLLGNLGSNLAWELGTFGSVFLRTFRNMGWEPCLGTCSWELCLALEVNHRRWRLIGNPSLPWEAGLGTFLEKEPFWESLNLAWGLARVKTPRSCYWGKRVSLGHS